MDILFVFHTIIDSKTIFSKCCHCSKLLYRILVAAHAPNVNTFKTEHNFCVRISLVKCGPLVKAFWPIFTWENSWHHKNKLAKVFVLFYSFLYSGKCSFYSKETFTNNSCIPSL